MKTEKGIEIDENTKRRKDREVRGASAELCGGRAEKNSDSELVVTYATVRDMFGPARLCSAPLSGARGGRRTV